jgi:hypothetical protein
MSIMGRGKRTIAIDHDLLALLRAEKEKHLRIRAGVPDHAAVELSLVKLPEGALMFPNPPAPGEDFSFTKTSARRASSALPGYVCTIYEARTRRCCLTLAYPCTSSPPGADMIRRCYCAATRSAQRKRTQTPLPLSAPWRRAS